MASESYDNVIIFGATGATGSVAAHEAHKRGANVWLAVRNLTKPIPGLSSSDEESSDRYKRVQADLTDPTSIKAAVEKSGAKAAYLYFIPGPDGMRTTINALKEGGITYVVFLSSYTIRYSPVDQVGRENLIAFGHAQVEKSLAEAGLPFTALRPGFFASNSFNHNLDTSTSPWTANMMRNTALWDNISPVDIGRVAGATLVTPPAATQSPNGQEIIFLFGPKLLTQDEMWSAIQSASSQKIELNYQSAEDYGQHMIKSGIPPPIAKYLVNELASATGDRNYSQDNLYEGNLGSQEKYSGYKPETFEEYLSHAAP